MAILTNGDYYSGAYLTGDLNPSEYLGYPEFEYINEFNFPLGMQEKNLAIYSTAECTNVETYGEYMFKEIINYGDRNLIIKTFLNDTEKEYIVDSVDVTTKDIYSFSYLTSQPFDKIRIGTTETFATFDLGTELSAGTHLGITVTVTNDDEDNPDLFIFGKVMIVDRLEEFVPFQPSLTDVEDGNREYENYLEIEPFKIQGKYGPRILVQPYDDAIKNNLIDVEVIPTYFNGIMTVYNSDGLREDIEDIEIRFDSPNQLTCASINQMVAKALIDRIDYSEFPIYFKYFNKMCWKEFNLECNINCYYHNTKDIITTYNENDELTGWTLSGKTVTLTEGYKGGTLNNLFYLDYVIETDSLMLDTVSTKFNITGATVGDYVVIPNLKKHKLYLGEAANSRYQCLFGENSIDGILNYYTEQGTYHLSSSSINNNESFDLYVVSDDIGGVDYKIIPCGLNYDNDNGDTIACNQLSLSTNQLQIYSLSNNYFQTSSAIDTMTFNNAYSVDGYTSKQVVYVYLFDEDEFSSYIDKTEYNDVSNANNNEYFGYFRRSFIPTAPDTLTESMVSIGIGMPTLSGITNGLLKRIQFGVKVQGDSNDVNSPYIDFEDGETDVVYDLAKSGNCDTLITLLDFSSHLLSGKVLQNDSIQKENFTFTSCESIFFDGIPHPCNKDYYLTGNIVMVPNNRRDYTFSNYFYLFIGARRITQEILNKTIGYYGPIDFTSDYFSYDYSSELREINETDFRISNKIASIEDLNKKAFSYYAPSLIRNNLTLSSPYERTYNGYFKYFNEHMFNPTNEFLKYITSGTISGGLGVEDNLKVRGVQLFNFVEGNTEPIGWVYENERDIKPMIYPCYKDKTSTDVMYIDGVCISEPSNTNILYIYALEDYQYQDFLNAWNEYNHAPDIVVGFNKQIVYSDGTIIDSINISAPMGVSVAEWNYNSGDVGLYPSGGIGNCIGQMHIHVAGNIEDKTTLSDKYKETFNSIFDNNYPLLPSEPVLTFSNAPDNVPTINDAFRNYEEKKYCGCTILIKFDFNKQLYYMDVSFSLTIPNIFSYSIKKNEFMDNFKATVLFDDSSSGSIYPLGNDKDKELLNTFELNDNSATISFRIYETNKVPFNVNGNNMSLVISYRLDRNGTPYTISKNFNVSSCLIQSDHASYQNWLFHYVPCKENKDIASNATPSMGTGSYYSLSGGTFSDDSTGLKLKYTVNAGPTNIYAASWPASSNNVNLYDSSNVYTGTCIVSSAVIVFTNSSTGTAKFAIPFNFSNSVFPLVSMFDLTSSSHVVGNWYLLHYSQNINDGNYVYSIYDGSSTKIITDSTYRNVYNEALNRSNKSPIYVGFRPSSTTSNPYLLYGINIKYVDMSYLNDITHNNLYF